MGVASLLPPNNVKICDDNLGFGYTFTVWELVAVSNWHTVALMVITNVRLCDPRVVIPLKQKQGNHCDLSVKDFDY